MTLNRQWSAFNLVCSIQINTHSRHWQTHVNYTCTHIYLLTVRLCAVTICVWNQNHRSCHIPSCVWGWCETSITTEQKQFLLTDWWRNIIACVRVDIGLPSNDSWVFFPNSRRFENYGKICKHCSRSGCVSSQKLKSLWLHFLLFNISGSEQNPLWLGASTPPEGPALSPFCCFDRKTPGTTKRIVWISLSTVPLDILLGFKIYAQGAGEFSQLPKWNKKLKHLNAYPYCEG